MIEGNGKVKGKRNPNQMDRKNKNRETKDGGKNAEERELVCCV